MSLSPALGHAAGSPHGPWGWLGLGAIPQAAPLGVQSADTVSPASPTAGQRAAGPRVGRGLFAGATSCAFLGHEFMAAECGAGGHGPER